MKAIMAASFDPITNGHVDVAVRAARIFDDVVVAVYSTPKKQILFGTQERVAREGDARWKVFSTRGRENHSRNTT